MTNTAFEVVTRAAGARDVQRFLSHVAVSTCGCWIWTAARDRDGYGLFKLAGVMVRAHRYAYQTFAGGLVDGLPLDHLCRTRACVNPFGHLEHVTWRENVLRGETAPAANVLKDSCKQGHDLDEANTYVTARGWRACRTCHTAWTAAWRERNRERAAADA